MLGNVQRVFYCSELIFIVCFFQRAEKLDMESPPTKNMDGLFAQGSPMMRARLVHTNPSTEENGKLFELTTVVKTEHPSNNQSCQNDPVSEYVLPSSNDAQMIHDREEQSLTLCKPMSKVVDRVSRVLFPLMWIVYNLIYWKKFLIN